MDEAEMLLGAFAALLGAGVTILGVGVSIPLGVGSAVIVVATANF